MMKQLIGLAALAVVLTFWHAPARAQDLRVLSQQARARLEAARIEKKAAEQRILNDREALKAAVADQKVRIRQFKEKSEAAKEEIKALAGKIEALEKNESETRDDIDAYVNVARRAAREVSAIISRSPLSARLPHRTESLAPALDTARFPGIEEITAVGEAFFQEMAKSGEVDRFACEFIDRGGNPAQGTLLTLGKFTAAYRNGEEIGFLRYSEASGRFQALANLPPRKIQKNIASYMDGQDDAVYLDPSSGSALRRISHRVTLTEKIRKGGILVWPILGIGLLAALLTAERLVFLQRVHANADRVMGRFNELAGRGNWRRCEKILGKKKNRPVYNVLRAGLSATHETRETLENILQEAILKELPRLERFLPALGIMAAVSPLLGLLGTVTGMIGTFHVITLYGTGDPRLMSGGISEALVTTMLGLAVAIPVMLVHAFLRRRIEHIVGDMEEKALAFCNIVCRGQRPDRLCTGPVRETTATDAGKLAP